MKQIKLASHNHMLRYMSILCLLVTIALWGNSLSIYAKAYLAKYLIADAWESTITSQEHTKPWQWADTWPVAKMVFPSHQQSLIVLAGANGSSLAFGPGHVSGTSLFSENGTKVVGGHRDTHFGFLQNVKIGDSFMVQDEKGIWKTYTITGTEIVNTKQRDWHIDHNKSQVQLVTCYPFDSISPGGPLRYVVSAEQRPSEQQLLQKQLAEMPLSKKHSLGSNRTRYAHYF